MLDDKEKFINSNHYDPNKSLLEFNAPADKAVPANWDYIQPTEAVHHRVNWGIYILVFGLIVFALASVYGLYVFYYKSNQLDQNKILLNIESQDSVDPGKEFPVKLSISNNNKIPIINMRLDYEYSQSVDSSGVANIEKKNFSYESLGYGETKNETIDNVKVYGRNGDSVTMHAKLLYSIEGNNAQFSKTIDKEIKILPRLVGLNLEGPKDIDGGVAFTYRVQVKNDSDRDLGNSRVVFAFPAEYSTLSSTLPLNDRNEWEIFGLKKGDSIENVITATQGGINGEEKTIRVKLEEMVTEETGATINDNNYTYGLIYLPLNIMPKLTVNHNTSSNIYVGQQGTLSLTWENTLNESIANLSLMVTLDGTSTVIDKTSFPAMSEIAAGDKSTIELPIIGKAEPDGYMHLNITAHGDRLQSDVSNTKIGSVDFYIKVRN